MTKATVARLPGASEPSVQKAGEEEQKRARERAEARERRKERIAAIDPDNLPPVITVDEVAALLRLNRKTVYEQFKQGKIPGGRWFGNVIRFRRDSVLSWLGEGRGRASRSSRRSR